MHELLTPDEMAQAEASAMADGVSGLTLMQRAGRAVAREMLARFPAIAAWDVLCGPGNNGGDGYVVATELAAAGVAVALYGVGAPRAGSDAQRAAAACPLPARPLADFRPDPARGIVDALFGAGLSRTLDPAIVALAERCAASGAATVAIDLPSGVSGESGASGAGSFRADLTVTFVRPKPGHVLLPGRGLCGETVVRDIGVGPDAVRATGSALFVNHPDLWRDHLPRPAIDTHKYERGAVLAFTGGPSATGAGRLAALAAARAGAGAVTVVSPSAAILVNAAHLTAIMLARCDGVDELDALLSARKADAAVIGPGFGMGERLRNFVTTLLGRAGGTSLAGGVVLDADALTSFEESPDVLFEAVRGARMPVVLTPHEGEFRRLFPDLASGVGPASKVERARRAAGRSGTIVILKGADTVVAAPGGRAVIGTNGSPTLATAGSGDVLAGIVAGLLAQRVEAPSAAAAGVWIHSEAGRRFGPGLIADDLPALLPPVLRDLFGPPH